MRNARLKDAFFKGFFQVPITECSDVKTAFLGDHMKTPVCTVYFTAFLNAKLKIIKTSVLRHHKYLVW